MSKATKITFQREVTDKIKDIPLVDGQLIYNIETGATYQDVPATTNNTTTKQQQEKQEIVRIKTSSGNINPILYPPEDKDRAYLYLEIDKDNNKTISWKTIDEISHNGFLPRPNTISTDAGRCLICVKKNEDSSIETAWQSFIPAPSVEGVPGCTLILDENNNPVWRDLGNNEDKEGYMKNPISPSETESGPWNLQMSKEDIKDESGKETIGIKYVTKWNADKNIKYPETKAGDIPENSVLSINKDKNLFWQLCIPNPVDTPKEDSLLLVDKNNNTNWRPADFYLPTPTELPNENHNLILQYRKETVEVDNPNYSENKPDEPAKINQTIWRTYWEKVDKYISSPESNGQEKQVLTLDESLTPSWETPPYINAPSEKGIKGQFLVSDGEGGTFWRSFSELFINGEEIGY